MRFKCAIRSSRHRTRERSVRQTLLSADVRASGSVLLEFVIAFPVVLVLIFACVQFAHIWVARMVTHYAAYCAARSTLVCKEEEYPQAALKAAQRVCAWVVVGKARDDADVAVPGWGAIEGSGGAERKVRVTVAPEPEWNVTATVYLDFGLITPIVGPIIAWGMNPWSTQSPWSVNPNHETRGAQDAVPYPHIVLTETVTLPKPYRTLIEAGF